MKLSILIKSLLWIASEMIVFTKSCPFMEALGLDNIFDFDIFNFKRLSSSPLDDQKKGLRASQPEATESEELPKFQVKKFSSIASQLSRSIPLSSRLSTSTSNHDSMQTSPNAPPNTPGTSVFLLRFRAMYDYY